MGDTRGPSTRELITDAEKLRSGKKEGDSPGTRQLLRESEKLIGRRKGSSKALLLAVLFVVALGVAAAVLWRFL